MTKPSSSVAFFLPNLNGGGAERVMLDVSIWLHMRGVKVTLLLLQKQGAYLADVPSDMPVKQLTGGGLLPLQWLSLLLFLRKSKPQALLSTLIGCNIAAALAGRFSGGHSRIVLREADTFSRRMALRHPLIRLLYGPLTRWCYHWADAILAVSDGVAEDLVHCLPKTKSKISVIYNPTVTPRVRELSQQPCSHPWLKDKSLPTILSAGRLEPQKDFSTLLDAFARLVQEIPARLIVLGEGSRRRALQQQAEALGIADAVDFAGFQANPFSFMGAADLYVLSSRNEGMPNALIQALACGCPVVATDCPSGPREVLEHGQYGPLVPVGDAAALAVAMRAQLERPIVREMLIARAEAFSLEHNAPRYAALLGIDLAEAE